ncbi:hypothetical protein ACF0H5_011074 [Mactra antiquata]
MTQKTIQHKSKQGIDRGWAWVVLLATFLSTALQCVNVYMGGILQIALLNKVNEGQTKTSLVGALNNGLMCLTCGLLLIGSALGSITFCNKQKTKTIDTNAETSVEDCQNQLKEASENNTLSSK